MLALCLFKVGLWCRQAERTNKECEGEQVMLWESRETRRPVSLAADYVSCLAGSWGVLNFVARVVGLSHGDTSQAEDYEHWWR